MMKPRPDFDCRTRTDVTRLGVLCDRIMRIAYLDCFSGISGDMFLGALVDAGVSPRLLEETVAALHLDARLEISRVNRSGISATKVDVYAAGEKDLPREAIWDDSRSQPAAARAPAAPSGHSHHEHRHEQEPVQLLEHNYPLQTESSTRPAAPVPHHHTHGHNRGLREICEIIRNAAISESAKTTAIAIFRALGEAEAKIHNADIESIHFHEVGAVDAMVDIVCAAVGTEALSVGEIVCSPLNVGGGTVECAHGTFPVPAPATVELLRNAPVYSSGLQAELVTPTGAAIVKTLVTRFAPYPPMTVGNTGYGAGTRNFQGHANVLRLTLGEAFPEAETRSLNETIAVLEANLDDLNPQVFGYVMDRLLEEGALDVFGMPVQMKKNRPGMLLTVLCKPEQVAKLSNLIFAETTTLGIRQRQEQRQVLVRKWVTVATRWGDVRMKVASLNGTVTNYAPEYEDCRRLAADHRVALKLVMQEALQEYLRPDAAHKSR